MPTKGLYLLCTWWITLLLNQANSSNPVSGCDYNPTEQAGTILTPNYPNTYPNNVHCSWKISVATGQIISLKMKTFNLDFSDYVVFHDGPSAQSPIIGITRYTGFWDNTKLTDTIIRSTGPEMFIYFYSDYSVAASGFGASYWAHECKKFTYGIPECSTSCNCIQENTLYCNNFDGTCICKHGWTSYDCSTDVNECSNPHTCEDEYTECRNLNGSYTCDCRPGLKNINGKCADSCSPQNRQCSHLCGATENPHKEHCYCPIGMELSSKDNMSCVECSNWHYGKDCCYPATCNTYNTQYFNKTNGLCTCYLNWTSTNCDQDFNECSLTHSPCNTTSSVCENSYGSFKCWCLQGFESRSENTCRECGRVLTNSSGIIDTYTYDRYHYITTRVTTPICTWTILATRGYVIELKFQSFIMYNGYQRKFGYLEIYDGGDSKGTLLAVYDGMMYRGRTPGNVRTRTNQMHIAHFTSQYGYVNQYFTASYNTLVCPPFMYDTNCSVPCNCNQSNTEYCNSTNGQCVCKSRWTSPDCSQYKNECQDNSLACPDYSDCIYHNNGTFSCLCKEGLQQAANESCSKIIIFK